MTLDSTSTLPLHYQLYEQMRRLILTGHLRGGQRVPSTRTLAQSLRVARGTVTLGYEQLISEGYLFSVTGSGTYVSHQLPDDLIKVAPEQNVRRLTQQRLLLSTYGQCLSTADPFTLAEPESLINFRHGRPALKKFPLELWRKLLLRHSRRETDVLDYTSDILGYRPLREAIASYLARSRGVQSTAEQILIVSGSQQALDLIAKLLLDPGDTVALENPGYLGARHTFTARGAKVFPISVDEEGAVIKCLQEGYSSCCKLVCVTPSHQFPTGAVLSLPRRLELLAWAQKSGGMIIEDDYDSEYRYGERPVPALQGLDQGDSVIYMGTFSKVLFPSLRIGYLVIPKNLVQVFTRAKWLADRQSPLLEQYVLADFINEGHLERHIRRMRILYNRHRRVLVDALLKHFGNRAVVMGENAGMHLMVRLHTDFDDKEIVSRAAKAGVGIDPAYPYYLEICSRGEFVLGYTEVSEQQIQEGIYRLAQVLI